jgi:hypothetical protein
VKVCEVQFRKSPGKAAHRCECNDARKPSMLDDHERLDGWRHEVRGDLAGDDYHLVVLRMRVSSPFRRLLHVRRGGARTSSNRPGVSVGDRDEQTSSVLWKLAHISSTCSPGIDGRAAGARVTAMCQCREFKGPPSLTATAGGCVKTS